MVEDDEIAHAHLAYFGSELDCAQCTPQCKGHYHRFDGNFINCGEVGCITGPVGIQRKRIKGWKKPRNTICVNRPLKYGNPFRLGATMDGVVITRENFRPYYTKWLLDNYSEEEIQNDLKGKNIACFCEYGLPCHRDILLEIANR
jgi:hypothetical protein